MDINNILRGVAGNTAKAPNTSEAQLARSGGDQPQVIAARTTVAETVTLTDTGSQLRQLAQKAAEKPEVDSARVEQLRKALADGTYKVSADRIAARLMAFEAVLTNR